MYTESQQTYSNGNMSAPYNPNSLTMYPEMLSGTYQPYTQSHQYHATTPNSSCDWGSYPNTPMWTTSNANEGYNQQQHQRSNSGVYTGCYDHAPTQKVEGKKYRHDPYACSTASEQSTPPISPVMSASNTGSFYGSDNYAALPGPAAPVYDPAYADANAGPSGHVMNTTEDQFNSIIGCIAQTACTPRGRTLLLNVIRLQHLDKIQLIFEELCANFSAVICDPQGCHVFRFIVEFLQESDIDLLMNTLDADLTFQLATHSQHSRRVLQCLVEQHKTIRLTPLIDILSHGRNAINVAKTQQGCIAIMRVLENVLPEQKEQLFRSIAPAFPELSVDQYGNYTVQTAIQQFDREFLSEIFCEVFYGQFLNVACNKFGSNVMEKIVQIANNDLLVSLLQQLCYTEKNLHRLMHDGYGNFVIQSLVEATAHTPEGRRLCETIKPHLQSSPYGHKIEAKLRSKRLLTSSYNEANIRGGNSSCGNTTSSCASSVSSGCNETH